MKDKPISQTKPCGWRAAKAPKDAIEGWFFNGRLLSEIPRSEIGFALRAAEGDLKIGVYGAAYRCAALLLRRAELEAVAATPVAPESFTGVTGTIDVVDAAFAAAKTGGADHDAVDHPPHYNAHPSGVECITVTEHMSFNLGNALKYIWRADEKGNAIEDLKKAAWYVAREIAKRERVAI